MLISLSAAGGIAATAPDAEAAESIVRGVDPVSDIAERTLESTVGVVNFPEGFSPGR